MDGNSGSSSKRGKLSATKKGPHIKKLSIKQENEYLKIEKRILEVQNQKLHEMKRRTNQCGDCIKTENAYLKLELARLLRNVAAALEADARSKLVVKNFSTSLQIPADTSATMPRQPGAAGIKDEPPAE